jgi:hypothetical protein
MVNGKAENEGQKSLKSKNGLGVILIGEGI